MTILTSELNSESNCEKNITGAESVRCALDPKYFLKKFAWIQNKNTAKTVKWLPWGFQLDLLNRFLQEDEIVILKARQLGISWLVSGYGLWKALFNDSAKVLFLSQGEEEAWDMVSKARFIWEHLPEFLRIPIRHDSRSQIRFLTNNSEIRALPSTDKAGRGTDATLVVRDELAQHPYGKENFTAINPAIDAGGQLIDLSTINKLDAKNHFTDRVVRAKNGEGSAKLIFLGWGLRPVRQEGMSLEDWFETRIKRKYSAFEIEQEYPATFEEALRPSETQCFFNVNSLYDMRLHFMKPLEKVDDFDTRNGVIRIYKKPVVGRRYIAFTDPSEGIEDPFVTIVLDWQTGEGVATATARLPAKEVARIHDSLVRYYNNAQHSGEVNAQAGGVFIDTIKELDTPNITPRRSPDGKIIQGKLGWYTNEPLKDRMLVELKNAVFTQSIIIHDKDALDEFQLFVQPEGEPKPRTIKGGHDDWVMAWAGAWYLRKFYIPPEKYTIKSTKYKIGS